MKPPLALSILEVLRACDGVPMPEAALLCAVRIHSRPEQPSQSDILDALLDVEAQGCAAALTDPLFKERTWTLTTKGHHKARQFRSGAW